MASPPALGPIKRRTVRAGIVETLREAIQQRQLAPGTRLSDAELAAQLGASHSTVREALHQLTHERLVISAPHRGFFVAGFSLGDLIDLVEMRGLLEGRIAEAAVDILDTVDLAALAAAAGAIGHCESGESAAFWEADAAFHTGIVRRCGKPILVELWSTLSSRLTMLELLFHDAFDASRVDSRAHHLGYLAELGTRDPLRARRAAEAHYQRTIECLRQFQARAGAEADKG